MKILRFLPAPLAAALLVAVAPWIAPRAARAAAAVANPPFYTCSMHPQILEKEPGNCPICGMKLVPVMASGGTVQHRILYYKSSMNPGETSEKPGKDSMGMDLVPVYEDQADYPLTG